MEEQARLTGVPEERPITRETEPAFWAALQQAVLLGLREEGVLDEAQYRRAEELRRRRLPRGAGEEGGP